MSMDPISFLLGCVLGAMFMFGLAMFFFEREKEAEK